MGCQTFLRRYHRVGQVYVERGNTYPDTGGCESKGNLYTGNARIGSMTKDLGPNNNRPQPPGTNIILSAGEPVVSTLGTYCPSLCRLSFLWQSSLIVSDSHNRTPSHPGGSQAGKKGGTGPVTQDPEARLVVDDGKWGLHRRNVPNRSPRKINRTHNQTTQTFRDTLGYVTYATTKHLYSIILVNYENSLHVPY